MLASLAVGLMAAAPGPEVAYPFERTVDVALYAEASPQIEALAAVIEETTRARVVLLSVEEVRTCTKATPTIVFSACIQVVAEDFRKPPIVIAVTRGDEEIFLVWTFRKDLEDELERVASLQRGPDSSAGLGEALVALEKRVEAVRQPSGGAFPLSAPTPEAASEAFRSEVLPQLTSVLAAADAVFEAGDVLVRVAPGPATVRLDGEARPIGEDGLRYRGLRRGPHALEASAPGRIPRTLDFELMQEELTLRLDLEEDWRVERWVAGSGGLALLAGGVVLSVLAAQEPDARAFPTFGSGGLPRLSAPEGVVVFGSDHQGSGPLLAGLAAGTLVAGGTLAALGFIGAEEPRPPWLDILVSLAAGLATYGALELYDAASR